jgi:hypothetical protein
MLLKVLFATVLLSGAVVIADREVIVVSSCNESEEPGVLEIYDFLTRTWR